MIKILSRVLIRPVNYSFPFPKWNFQRSSQCFCTNLVSSAAAAPARRFYDHGENAVLVTKLKDLLQCNQREAEKIMTSSSLNKLKDKSQVLDTIQFLLDQKISPGSILENPWLMLQTEESLRWKLMAINNMSPRNLQDFVPLMRMNHFGLQRLVRKSLMEKKTVPGGHRIYFLSSRLGIEPKVISKYLSTRQFIFNISFSSLNAVLIVLMKYNIAPKDILKDLWVFRYKPQVLELRFERAKQMSVKKLMPWMSRCTEPIFENHLKISEENRAVLGENRTTVEYLAERLNLDVDTVRQITSRFPMILRIRMTKIKEFLDFLLIEAGFTSQDIVKVPQIFNHSLETTRNRLKELNQNKCVPTSLSILCLSQKNYQKFLQKWVDNKD